MRLSFDDSLKGVETTIPVELETACRECNGSGARPGTAPVLCPECHGRGVISESQGLFALSQPCPRCRGNGTVIEEPCPNCRGTGRERRTKRYTVKIPAGVKDGSQIRLRGKGEAGWGGAEAGDLFVVTRVAPSDTYTRRGDDLVVDVPVTYPEAALGAQVQVPTPDGPVTVKVKPGTEDGTLLRVKGKGAPKLKGSGRGNVLARVKLTVPKKLSKKEREADRGAAEGGRMRVGLVTFAERAWRSTWLPRSRSSPTTSRGPGWINPLWLVATLLVVVGLLVMVNTAVRVYRERT